MQLKKSICQSCTNKCNLFDEKRIVTNCDEYNGMLKDVRYNGCKEQYKKDLEAQCT